MSTQTKNLNIAIIHDWLLGISGAERVVKSLHEIFPDAPIYTLFYDPKFTRSFLPKAAVRTTFLQKPFRILKKSQLLVPLMPLAIESLDLSDFDVVISSSVSFSKGLILKPKTTHICYCYSPARQVWDWNSEYRGERHKMPGVIVAMWQHLFRIWDRQASSRVDHFVAISDLVKKRIKKYYGVDSTVIYPPVEVAGQQIKQSEKLKDKEYFLIVSRLFKNKNVNIAVEAFNKLGWTLVVVGDGPERKGLINIARPNVHFVGYQSDQAVKQYYASCLGFIMPQEEDFGITPIEAFGFGKPVLALRRGGALEYVEEGINGEFFDDPVPEVLADGARRLKENLSSYDPEKIKKTAERFSEGRFKKEIIELINKA